MTDEQKKLLDIASGKTCAHENIVALPDNPGSAITWGRCLACGDDSFVLRDRGYEQLVRSERAYHGGVLARNRRHR